ncbi:peroxiredoxin-like family protein [Roseiarcus fermentans]|nr:peroxiredoxin-like family protein [Roseiarcus fermentans]
MDAPLSVRLQAVADTVRALSPAFADVIERMVARLADNGVGVTAPRPGEPMPPFLLPDETGRLVSLAGLLKRGPLVVSFNRGHWCPYCRLHIDALTRAEAEIASLGAQIVAISPETSAWAAELKAYAEARFPILSDLDGGYALELNLLFWVGDEAQRGMAAAGVDLAQFHGNDTWMLPIPATFVVDADGIVLARFVDPDYRRRMEVEDLLETLRGYATRSADQAR